MILDTLANQKAYRHLGSAFARAFTFLGEKKTRTLAPGTYPVWGKRVRAIVSMEKGRHKAKAPLEVHRAHIDIHFLIAGMETLGWRPMGTCAQPLARFNAERDIQFFRDPADHWVSTLPGQFVVFFPEDCHAPGVGNGLIHKVVIKIRV